MEKHIQEYCTQNNGDCKTCSLVNYGRDCKNNQLFTCNKCGEKYQDAFTEAGIMELGRCPSCGFDPSVKVPV